MYSLSGLKLMLAKWYKSTMTNQQTDLSHKSKYKYQKLHLLEALDIIVSGIPIDINLHIFTEICRKWYTVKILTPWTVIQW